MIGAEEKDLDDLLADLCKLEEDTKAQLAAATGKDTVEESTIERYSWSLVCMRVCVCAGNIFIWTIVRVFGPYYIIIKQALIERKVVSLCVCVCVCVCFRM